ncbi:MAG: hypothetical protein M1826_001894 [Phylliscum demangeonii]|nr:MAG: hypothetical protein M1826_001894 [Phylliscum demangeonii]
MVLVLLGAMVLGAPNARPVQDGNPGPFRDPFDAIISHGRPVWDRIVGQVKTGARTLRSAPQSQPQHPEPPREPILALRARLLQRARRLTRIQECRKGLMQSFYDRIDETRTPDARRVMAGILQVPEEEIESSKTLASVKRYYHALCSDRADLDIAKETAAAAQQSASAPSETVQGTSEDVQKEQNKPNAIVTAVEKTAHGFASSWHRLGRAAVGIGKADAWSRKPAAGMAEGAAERYAGLERLY